MPGLYHILRRIAALHEWKETAVGDNVVDREYCAANHVMHRHSQIATLITERLATALGTTLASTTDI